MSHANKKNSDSSAAVSGEHVVKLKSLISSVVKCQMHYKSNPKIKIRQFIYENE